MSLQKFSKEGLKTGFPFFIFRSVQKYRVPPDIFERDPDIFKRKQDKFRTAYKYVFILYKSF